MTVLQDQDLGAVDLREVFVRLPGDDVTRARIVTQQVAVGSITVGIDARVESHTVTWRLDVVNDGPEPVMVDSVGLGLAWSAIDTRSFRLYRQGFQSWSFAGSGPLDDAGTAPFPSPRWLRGFYHVLDAPPPDRDGWHESDGVAAAGPSPAGPTIVAGVLETGVTFGVVYLRRIEAGLAVEIEQRLERQLDPGERLELEQVHVALGPDAVTLLDGFATRQGRLGRARTGAPFQTGWCSWYHYFLDVDEEILLRNLDALAAARHEIPLDVFQLDGGYQRAYGDWLETNDKFPRGLEFLAGRVRDAGFTPGIWTAPFCVVPESRVFADHPDWLLRRGDALLRCLYDRSWTPEGWIYALDPTHEEVAAHLERIFRTTVDWGFTYHKLDFLYSVALQSTAHDARATRAQRLRRGLEAIRHGTGPDAFILGCGCPLGPAVGVVDGMRIGPDTAPWWATMGEAGIPGVEPTLPGLEPTVPSGANALRNTLSRSWMHRRLWLNDPDCLMARTQHTRLSEEERGTLARSIAISGGMTILSDDISMLGPTERALVRDALTLARTVDAAVIDGAAIHTELLAAPSPPRAAINTPDGTIRFEVNVGPEPATVPVGSGPTPVEPLMGTPPARPDGDGAAVSLPAHGSALYRLAPDQDPTR